MGINLDLEVVVAVDMSCLCISDDLVTKFHRDCKTQEVKCKSH
jgi:hypothetical protein